MPRGDLRALGPGLNRLRLPMVLRRTTTAAGFAVALALTLGGLTGCGKADEVPGKDEPAREGLAIPLDGVEYNVFITRELNLRIPPDSAYYEGPAAPKGQTLYGVFLEACNKGKRPRRATGRFKVVDNQGSEFEPTELPKDNQFAYHPRVLNPDECIPEAGSVAQQGPTAGAMLLYKLPLDVTENRPLELEIESAGGSPQKRTVELDL
jgi:hypothetical protein